MNDFVHRLVWCCVLQYYLYLICYLFVFYVNSCVVYLCCFFFFFKQKTAYELRISDWSSDVCSSDLYKHRAIRRGGGGSSRGIKHSLGQKLRDVARPSACPLDLLAAAEAVGEDQAFFRRFPHGGQQHSLTDGGGDIMRLLGEAERAGHAATALGREIGRAHV